MNEDQLKQIEKSIWVYPHVFVNVVPFSREIICDELIEGQDFIPYGSTLLTTLGVDRKWKGLHFDLSRMNYRCFLDNHPDMLNDNVLSVQNAIDYLKDVNPDQEFFTRPSEDLKQYSGQVMIASEIRSWLQSMVEAVGGGSYYMDPQKQIVLCEPKAISAEWRWFIVGGQIISGSMYRAHGQLRKLKELDKSVIDEAQALADKWLPDDCVVMDTALVGDEIKVIEFNCINSSGFYDNDIGAVFDALYKHHC